MLGGFLIVLGGCSFSICVIIPGFSTARGHSEFVLEQPPRTLAQKQILLPCLYRNDTIARKVQFHVFLNDSHADFHCRVPCYPAWGW